MEISELPVGSAPQPLLNPLFPLSCQNFIWRNWGLIPAEKLAAVLKAPLPELRRAAEEMGLDPEVAVDPKWLTRGYLTLIRNNWHLLNYEQLLQMLNWSADKLAYTLKEEDFFWHKLGLLKPAAAPLRLLPRTEEELRRTAKIKEALQKYFPADGEVNSEGPFAFADLYHALPDTGKKEPLFDFSFIHSYAASCGDVLGEAELNDPVPENLLEQYRSIGIRGIWFHAILYLLCPIAGAEEFSAGFEKRLAHLEQIVARCGKYGIKVYLYFNEPRTMPEKFYELKPEWKGIFTRNAIANCTTRTPEILEYLEHALENIFTRVPELGGVFTITMSENTTNCHCGAEGEKCPSCRNFPKAQIIADVNAAMERGMHRAAPDAEMIFYDWAWGRVPGDPNALEFKKEVIELLPKGKHCHVNVVSEWGMETCVGGVKGHLRDYSISQVGPSKESAAVWKYAAKAGLGCVAKVQINNSWELAAVPCLPVPYLIREHLEKLRSAGVRGVMLSWTLGGYPGGGLALLNNTPEEIAQSTYSPETASQVCAAWRLFSESFRNFPFCVGTAYNAPTNFGPMNLLHLTPTNYRATMVGFPYDDLRAWCSIYPEEVFENQFAKLIAQWREGLEVLDNAASAVTAEEKAAFEELRRMAGASFCHFNACYNQVRFVRARNANDRKAMFDIAGEELENTLQLYHIARQDSRVGFEASNHYFYTLNDLREKVLNCLYVREELERSL